MLQRGRPPGGPFCFSLPFPPPARAPIRVLGGLCGVSHGLGPVLKNPPRAGVVQW